MLSSKIKQNLILIAKKLKNKNITWGLTGSCNLAFQGVDIAHFHDIDIIVLPSDLKKAEEIFKDNLVYPIKNKELKEDNTNFKTFKFKINGMEVEIIEETGLRDNCLSKNNKNLIKKKIDDIIIFCYPLKVELQAYKKFHRPKTVNKIKDFLNKK